MTAPKLLQRPILGGPFGTGGRYALASMPFVNRGLHSVRYVVVEPAAGTVLSVAAEKTEALAAARRVISAAQELARCQAVAAHHETRQGRLFPDELPVRDEAPPGTRRPVSRRRRDSRSRKAAAATARRR